MKVLVTINNLELGGSQLNAIDFAAAAAPLGVDTVIAGYRSTLPERGPTLIDAASERGVRLEILDAPMETVSAAPALARVADRHGADVVHAYGGWDLRAAFLGPCRWGRRPLVQTVYEMYVPSQTYRHQPLIVGTRYLLEEQSDVRPGAVELISPPVDLRSDSRAVDPTGFEREFRLDPSRCHVVIVSRLAASMKELGIRHAIEAIELLGRDDVDLLIVGSGDAEERLRDAGEKVNARLGRRAVVFCGAMYDPRAAYAAADLVIGMGGSAARALAFGKPLVVCGEHGWFRTFTPTTAPLLFRNSFWSDESEPAPVSQLAEQIRALVDDPDERRELGGFGRDFAEANFGLEAMTARLVNVYRTAVSTHRRRSWFLDLRTEASPGIAWLGRAGRRLLSAPARAPR